MVLGFTFFISITSLKKWYKVPFQWDYIGNIYEMEFVAGLIGVSQEPESLCLRPEIGWVVMEADSEAFPTK
jgi:hypothetical protein